jgi:hypothetical protein
LQRTVKAMTKVGIPAESREAVFATVAAVLHLGNVAFVEGRDSDSSMVAPGPPQQHLAAAGEGGGSPSCKGVTNHITSASTLMYCHCQGRQHTRLWRMMSAWVPAMGCLLPDTA